MISISGLSLARCTCRVIIQQGRSIVEVGQRGSRKEVGVKTTPLGLQVFQSTSTRPEQKTATSTTTTTTDVSITPITQTRLPNKPATMNPPPPEDTARIAKLKDNSHLANMALPEARQQSYEEIYGPPENVLEIEVCLCAFFFKSISPTGSNRLPISLPHCLLDLH